MAALNTPISIVMTKQTKKKVRERDGYRKNVLRNKVMNNNNNLWIISFCGEYIHIYINMSNYPDYNQPLLLYLFKLCLNILIFLKNVVNYFFLIFDLNTIYLILVIRSKWINSVLWIPESKNLKYLENNLIEW